MIRTVLAHLRAQWMGALALFLVLAGGTAYAANTIGSSDIINGQVRTVDIGNNQVSSADVRDDTLAERGPDRGRHRRGQPRPVPKADTLDGKDSKDFARLGGLVASDGSILQGSGFTVSHLGEGENQISFPDRDGLECRLSADRRSQWVQQASSRSRAAGASASARGRSRSGRSTTTA